MVSISQTIKDYVWSGGTFIALHTIGPYEIVEYWNSPASNIKDKTRGRHFGVYIDGERQGESFLSLDSALVGCVALRHEGRSHRADEYFFRMMGVSIAVEREKSATRAAAE